MKLTTGSVHAESEHMDTGVDIVPDIELTVFHDASIGAWHMV